MVLKKMGAILPPMHTPPVRLLGTYGISLPMNLPAARCAVSRRPPPAARGKRPGSHSGCGARARRVRTRGWSWWPTCGRSPCRPRPRRTRGGSPAQHGVRHRSSRRAARRARRGSGPAASKREAGGQETFFFSSSICLIGPTCPSKSGTMPSLPTPKHGNQIRPAGGNPVLEPS